MPRREGETASGRPALGAVLVPVEPDRDASWLRARADLDSAVARVLGDLLVKWYRADAAAAPVAQPGRPAKARASDGDDAESFGKFADLEQTEC